MRIRSERSSRSDCPFESYNKRSSAESRGRGAGEPPLGGPIDATRPIRALLSKSPRLPLSALSERQARPTGWASPFEGLLDVRRELFRLPFSTWLHEIVPDPHEPH